VGEVGLSDANTAEKRMTTRPDPRARNLPTKAAVVAAGPTKFAAVVRLTVLAPRGSNSDVPRSPTATSSRSTEPSSGAAQSTNASSRAVSVTSRNYVSTRSTPRVRSSTERRLRSASRAQVSRAICEAPSMKRAVCGIPVASIRPPSSTSLDRAPGRARGDAPDPS
jgi:hypothetical protein